MTGLSRFGFGLAALTVAALATPAVADSDGPRHLVPGSVLIFPVFDTREGFDTIITVTNTNGDRRIFDGGLRGGDVLAHYVYIDGDTWLESNIDVPLTPSDTFAVLVSDQQGDSIHGWLWVEARDPENVTCPIDFDFLIGSAILTNTDFNFEWEYAPYTFRALPCKEKRTEPIEDQEFGYSRNGHDYTEECPENPDEDYDQELNFNGIELDFFPDILYIDQFFGEGEPVQFPVGSFANTVYLLSTMAELTSGQINIWNNNEVRRSRGYDFDCWTARPLSGFSAEALADQLDDNNYNPAELNGIPYGWVEFLDHNDPILGCFVQQITKGRLDFIAGDAMHFAGTREAIIPRPN